MSSEPSTVYRVRGERVTWRAAGDQTVLLDIRKSVYLALDRSAAMLWPHLMAGATETDLVKVLTDSGTVEPARALADVRGFLAELQDIDIIERLDASPGGGPSPA
ncbi:PqqD family protein [Micromonospora sp. NPDC005298]|uniref:PqqD family protein n=1 Tax=Micromonospora sp. NPDC005298 TaxID=3156873 RepID=UPI0033BCA8CE